MILWLLMSAGFLSSVVSKIVIAFLSPLGSSLALWLLALLLAITGLKRLPFVIAVIGLLWLWVWSLPAVSLTVRATLENEYPARDPANLPACEAVVVLGGSLSPADARHHSLDRHKVVDRLFVALRLYLAGNAPLVVLSGGGFPTPEAKAMSVVLREFGVPDEAMILEGRSRNTFENACFSAELLRERGIDRVLLVTSALHMHRALSHFVNEGIKVVPVAVDHEVRNIPGLWRWIPDAEALEGSTRVIMEWVGQRLSLTW